MPRRLAPKGSSPKQTFVDAARAVEVEEDEKPGSRLW